jgi:hypothetical protein
MVDRATSQQNNTLPAQRGEIFPLAIGATVTAFDISALPLKTVVAAPTFLGGPSGASSANWIEVSLQAVTADVWYQFAPDNTQIGSCSPTAVIAGGGGTVVLTSASASPNFLSRIPSGTTVQVRINRQVNRVLVAMTTAGTATLLLQASSQP